ncbi:hypothetical protein K1T71_012206 [Dendrolimus kikuchii]|uniref:Uncharacterized protein n=1 Tax=Dendrolimus kikuchii TaxID=765133 RepID=A0ACC1CKW5_9NEOP|nr:hypothetical protein K1T71_012206 [Dendrolimus kikuchii]
MNNYRCSLCKSFFQITLLQLPIDILVNIFKRLQLSDLFNVILTCKTLKDLILSENTIWRHLFKDRLILHSSNKRTEQLAWSGLCRLSNNWCKGIFRNQVIAHHRTNYMPWLSFYHSEVLLVSVGSHLHCYPTNVKGMPNGRKICWRLHVPIKHRHDIRTNDISRFIVRKGQLVCGNRDGGVSIYKYCDIKQEPFLMCHIQDCHENGTVEVSAVEMLQNNNTIIVTGSNNSQYLNFWSWQNDIYGSLGYIGGNIMDIIINDGDGVRCMAVNESEDKMAIGLNGNSKPLLLDPNTEMFLMTAESTKDFRQIIRDICWHDENSVLYVTHSGVLELIDVRSHQTVYTARDPFHSKLYSLKSDGANAIVVGSSQYSRCVLYDIRNSSKHVQLYFTSLRPSPVYCLDFDPTKLIVAADRLVSVLDFNVSSAIPRKDYSDAFQT